MSEGVSGILSRLREVKQQGDGSWMACCPAHKDGSPSLHITVAGDGKILLKCFGRTSCDAEAIVAAIGLEMEDLFEEGPRNTPVSTLGLEAPRSAKHTKPEPRPTVKAMAAMVGVDEAFLRDLGWTDTRRGVVIPYRDEAGQVMYDKIRASLTGKPKYLYAQEGCKAKPYGLQRLEFYRSSHKSIVLVEGETDCAACWAASIPALGIPGVSNLGCLEKEHLRGITLAYVVREPDEAGREFVEGVAGTDRKPPKPGVQALLEGWGMKVHVIEMPVGTKDPAALRARNPEKFRATFRELCTQAAKASKPDPIVRLDSIKSGQVRWLRAPIIPRGMITVLAGHGGLGKSCMAAKWTAELTSGNWGNPERVLLFCAEDDPESVIRPRIEGCGGDLELCYVYRVEEGFGWRSDWQKLEAAVEKVKPGMVIFDPVVSFHEGEMSKARVVRQNLAPLNRLAKANGLAVVLVAHTNKREGSPEQLIGGSVDFWNASRSVLMVFADPMADDREPAGILAHAKHNYAKPAASRRYVVVDGVVQWRGLSPLTARQLSFKNPEDAGEREQIRDAKGWLKMALAEGPLSRAEVYRRASLQRLPVGVINRARMELDVRSRPRGEYDGEVMWYLEVLPGAEEEIERDEPPL